MNGLGLTEKIKLDYNKGTKEAVTPTEWLPRI